MIVCKNEKIVCPDGHVCGCVTKDVNDGEPITSTVVRVTGGERATKAGHIGHVCPTCGKITTEARDGRFRIYTKRGWVGEG
jgi:hypothetical protein